MTDMLPAYTGAFVVSTAPVHESNANDLAPLISRFGVRESLRCFEGKSGSVNRLLLVRMSSPHYSLVSWKALAGSTKRKLTASA